MPIAGFESSFPDSISRDPNTPLGTKSGRMGPVIDGKGLVSLNCFPSSSYVVDAPLVRRCRPASSPTVRLPTSKSKSPTSRYVTLRVSSHQRRFGIVSANSNLDGNFDYDESPSSSKEASFDIKLPRRNLKVQFTCNACGERTQRTINRVAYERGTVFVQCAGCLVNHKLVDNLGLVVEYDLREDLDVDSDGTG